MIDLDQLIQQANDLAPLPASTLRLVQMMNSPHCDLADVAELIAFDPALTGNVLRGANAATSGRVERVGTVQEAVGRLGTAQVLALAVAGGAKRYLTGAIPAYDLGEGALWRHAIVVASVAETLPSYCEVEVPPMVFTAAILHDIGKLVLGRFLSPDVVKYIKQAQELDHIERLAAETLLLSVHHGELGGLIAQHWQLPDRVVQAIIHHHDPETVEDVVCDVTYLSNLVGKQIEAMRDGHEFKFSVEPGVMARLGLTDVKLTDLSAEAAARYDIVSGRYNAV